MDVTTVVRPGAVIAVTAMLKLAVLILDDDSGYETMKVLVRRWRVG